MRVYIYIYIYGLLYIHTCNIGSRAWDCRSPGVGVLRVLNKEAIPKKE